MRCQAPSFQTNLRPPDCFFQEVVALVVRVDAAVPVVVVSEELEDQEELVEAEEVPV
jgi:hypothetical protein